MSAHRIWSRLISPIPSNTLGSYRPVVLSQLRILSTQSKWSNRSGKSGNQQGGKSKLSLATVSGVIAGGFASAFWLYHQRQRIESSLLPVSYAAEVESQDESEPKVVKLKKSQRRFNSYASREYKGEVVMTPRDFLQCILGSQIANRKCRIALSQREVEEMLKKTPSVSHGSQKLFRTVGHEGIITYSEYLFLVNALTKPQSGIDIAFRMIDTDCSGRIDFKEFLALRKMISPKENKSKEDDERVDEFKSTLIAHLFSYKTNREVNRQDFFRFFENLQKEVLELEFQVYSNGMSSISEIDFARILLNHVSQIDRNEFLERIEGKVDNTGCITFQMFEKFSTFIRSLDDFSVAMRMFAITNQCITKDEFNRALRASTGLVLDPTIVNVIFYLFDLNDDGTLHFEDFVDVLKSRRERRYVEKKANSLAYFKSCFKREARK